MLYPLETRGLREPGGLGRGFLIDINVWRNVIRNSERDN